MHTASYVGAVLLSFRHMPQRNEKLSYAVETTNFLAVVRKPVWATMR